MTAWKPHPGPQWDFCQRNEFEVLFGGSAGPGKTDCLVALATRDVERPGYKGLLLRRTFPRLREIMDRCWRLYPTIGGEYRATEHRWTFPTGDAPRGRKSTIELGHMQHEDDKYNYHGQEYAFVGFDELTQFTETQYTYLFSRARSTDPGIRVRVRSTTNPGGIGHNWVKERFVNAATPSTTFIDPRTGLSRVFIPAKIYDNPTLIESDPGYLSRLEALPEIERKRLLHGDWDVFSGQVFSELSMRTHGFDPFPIPPEWERMMVFDWGYAKPFSVGWYAVDFDGNLWRYREWYGCKEREWDTGLKMVARDVARQILDIEGSEKVRYRIADPSIWGPTPHPRKHESMAPSIFEDFSNEGVFFLKANNDRKQGKMQVHERFKLIEDVDTETGEILNERPRVFISNDCAGFWRTVPTLIADSKDPEDVDTDQEDHIYDEFRYACMARPVSPRKIERIPEGSFMRERQRLIRARQYASRHGVTLEAAYRRVH